MATTISFEDAASEIEGKARQLIESPLTLEQLISQIKYLSAQLLGFLEEDDPFGVQIFELEAHRDMVIELAAILMAEATVTQARTSR